MAKNPKVTQPFLSLSNAFVGAGGEDMFPNADAAQSDLDEQRKGNAALPYFPPHGLTRSGVACWWSIMRLIETYHAQNIPCFLWTLTTSTPLPDSYYGNMHSMLMSKMRDAVRSGDLKSWGGVRVIEPHPGGHGLHFHWVMHGFMPVHVIRKLATACGFGRIDVNPDPVSNRVASYLAKYLVKSRKDSSDVFGVRRWACIGDYDGVKTNDVVDESISAQIFRGFYRNAIEQGAPKAVAFGIARVEQARWKKYANEQA